MQTADEKGSVQASPQSLKRTAQAAFEGKWSLITATVVPPRTLFPWRGGLICSMVLLCVAIVISPELSKLQ